MDSSSPRTIIISSRHNNTTKQKAINISSLPPNPIQNPKLVLTHDIVRNTKTLHCIIYTNQQPSSKIEYPAAMRGYAGIMSTSCNKDIELNGQGHKVHMEECHHLWMPQGEAKNDPLWHLRISVLRDQCARGDCPSKSFVSHVSSTFSECSWLIIETRHSIPKIVLSKLPSNLNPHSAKCLISENAEEKPLMQWGVE